MRNLVLTAVLLFNSGCASLHIDPFSGSILCGEGLLRSEQGVQVQGGGSTLDGKRGYAISIQNDNPYPVFVRLRYRLEGVPDYEVGQRSGGVFGGPGAPVPAGRALQKDLVERIIPPGPGGAFTRTLVWTGPAEKGATVESLEVMEVLPRGPNPLDNLTLSGCPPEKTGSGAAQVDGWLDREGRRFLRVRLLEERSVLGFIKFKEPGKAFLLEAVGGTSGPAWGPRNQVKVYEEACGKQDFFQSLGGPAPCGPGPLVGSNASYEVTAPAVYAEY